MGGFVTGTILELIAVATGAGVLAGILAGLLGVSGLPPFSLGYVNLLAAAAIIPLTTTFSQVGVRPAHSIPRRALRLAFGGFLFIIAARMFLDLFSG